jgi:hypothetical protein
LERRKEEKGGGRKVKEQGRMEGRWKKKYLSLPYCTTFLS